MNGKNIHCNEAKLWQAVRSNKFNWKVKLPFMVNGDLQLRVLSFEKVGSTRFWESWEYSVLGKLGVLSFGKVGSTRFWESKTEEASITTSSDGGCSDMC